MTEIERLYEFLYVDAHTQPSSFPFSSNTCIHKRTQSLLLKLTQTECCIRFQSTMKSTAICLENCFHLSGLRVNVIAS